MTHEGIIMGYAGGSAAALATIKLWQSTFNHLRSISPVDAPMMLDLFEVKLGKSDYCGPGLRERVKFAVTMAKNSRCDMCSILEYDTIVFPEYKRITPRRDKVVWCGHIFTSADPKFAAPLYTQWPVTAAPDQWAEIEAAIMPLQECVADRLMAEAVMRAGYHYKEVQAHELLYSANTIDDSPEKIATAIERSARGCVCMQGAKKPETIAAVIRAYRTKLGQ